MKLRDLEEWLSVGEVAKRYGVSRQSVVTWLEDGRMRAVRTHIGWIIDPEDAARYMAEREEKHAKP